MAWKTPELIVQSGVLKVPLDSAGTKKPCVTTVNRMTIMLISASVLAFASCSMLAINFTRTLLQELTFAISLYRLNG